MELLAAKIPDMVSLAQGIPSFDTPEIVKKAAIKALNRGIVAKYSLTYGLPELRETIEQKLAKEGMYYDFEKEIIATAGSIEGITATLLSVISESKNEIILFAPSYTSYQEAVKTAGGKPVFSNLIEESGWGINWPDLTKKAGPRTAAILFCNPNNPTGTVFPKKDLLKIAELAKKHRFFIIADEVYKDFTYDAGKNLSFFSLAQLPELRKIIIRVFSLSKAYAMTGWRIGFLHSDEENVREIVKIHDTLVTCAPVISQYAAMAALDFADKEIQEFREEYLRRRDLICSRLNDLSEFLSYQKPLGAYFVFPKMLFKTEADADTMRQSPFPKSPSWNFALDLLKKAKVAVVPGLAFGPVGENHIRLSFGRSQKDINEAMERIKRYFESL